MTPTEKAKRSDALYYETVSVTRRVLCDMIANREADIEDARAENEHMRLKALAVMGELQEENERLNAENAKLREQMERLVTLLRADCDIEASWDGLRKFWSIGLTENGCLMRDRACKAEAENAKLREEFNKMDVWHSKELTAAMADNAKLLELVRKVLQFERAGCEGCPYASTCDADCLYDPDCPMREDIEQRMRELGVDE